MASNQILKKSVLGGFRKEDVINYVEGLQAEIHRLKKDIGAKNNELEKLEGDKTSAEALEKDFAALKAENDSLRAECDALKAELDEAKEKKALLLSEADNYKMQMIELDCVKVENDNLRAELEKCRSDYDSKITVYQDKIASIETMVASLEAACVNINESEAARVKAETVNEAVAKALAQVSEANDRIRTACVDYDSSSVMLKASVENLLNVLNSISEGNK